MRNYIKTNYTGDKLILSPAVAEMLNQFTPEGCPFRNYSLLDLLKDMFEMWSWTIDSDTSVVDFCKKISKCDAHMAAYGHDIINIINCFGGENHDNKN